MKYEDILTKEFLIKEYKINKKSTIDIAKMIGCDKTTVWRYLKIYNIPKNSQSDYGMNIGKKSGLYIDGRSSKTYYCIKCKRNTICYENVLYGSKLCRKCKGKLHGKSMKGKNNPNWKNGLNKNKYETGFNVSLKQKVRERDKNKCFLCGMKNNKHKEIYKFNLDVHHIDYNKKNHSLNNLITLCKKCHIKTNFNRNDWILYFEKQIRATY